MTLYLFIIPLFCEKLKVACNKVFKRLFGAPRDSNASAVFVSLNICNVATLMLCKLV